MTTATVPPSIPHEASRPRLARTRSVVLVGVYGLLSLWALALSTAGVGALITGQLPDVSLRFVAVAATCFKMLSVGPAVAVCVSRGRSVLAVRALLLGQVVWFVADLLAPQGDDGTVGAALRFLLGLVIWVGPWLVLSSDRRRLWRPASTFRPVVLAAAVLGAVPLVQWSVAASRIRLPVALNAEEMAELRFDLCGLPLMVLLAVAVAAVHRVAWWDLLVSLVNTALAALALADAVRPGSPGLTGAAMLLVPLALTGQRLRERRGARPESHRGWAPADRVWVASPGESDSCERDGGPTARAHQE